MPLGNREQATELQQWRLMRGPHFVPRGYVQPFVNKLGTSGYPFGTLAFEADVDFRAEL